MKRLALFSAALLAGALAVSGQENADDETRVAREVARLTRELEKLADAAAPPNEGRTEIRFYDVRDLVARTWDRVLDLPNLVPSKYQPPEPMELPEPCAPFEIDMLIELLRMGVEPASWDQIEGAGIEPKNNKLFIRTIPRVHGKIERFLAWCRQEAQRRVSVEVLAVPLRDGDADLLAVAPLVLPAKRAEALRAREPLGSVTLAGRDNQRLASRAGREIEYVQDHDVEIAEGSTIGDPVRRSLFVGCTALVSVHLDDGAEGALVFARLDFGRLDEEMRIHETEHGPVELPDLRVTRCMGAFWAPLDGTVVAGGGTAGDEPVVFLVTVRRRG